MKCHVALPNPFTALNSGPSLLMFRVAAAGIISLVAICVVMGGTSSAPGSLEQQAEIRKAAERDARVDKIISESGPSALPPMPMPDYYTSQSVSAVPTTTPSQSSSTTEKENNEEFVRQRDKSKAEAIALYPDVADHKTPLGKEVDRLIESYKTTDDPILYEPNAPMLITQVAAKNLDAASRKNTGWPAITLNEISLMLRSGFSSATVLQDLRTRHFAGKVDSEAETNLHTLGASPELISTLKNPNNAASESEKIELNKFIEGQALEAKRMAKEAAEQTTQQQRIARERANQKIVVPVQSASTFKLPSEIEADKKAAKATEITARKKYGEAHPVECETSQSAANTQTEERKGPKSDTFRSQDIAQAADELRARARQAGGRGDTSASINLQNTANRLDSLSSGSSSSFSQSHDLTEAADELRAQARQAGDRGDTSASINLQNTANRLDSLDW